MNDIIGSVAAKSAALSVRLRQQTDPLVIADRLDIALRAARELADRDFLMTLSK
jgi:hypothetical protein